MTRVTFLRHGEPNEDAVGTHYGDADVGLSVRGRVQSEAAAARLAETELDAVWSSDLVRASFLAELLAAPRGLEVQLDPALRERHLGAFQGKSYAEAEAAFPEEARELRERGEVYRVTDGENMADLIARVIPAVARLVEHSVQDSAEHVAVVAHGGPIRAVLGHVLGVPEENLNRIKIDYCSLTVVDWRARPRVLRVNA